MSWDMLDLETPVEKLIDGKKVRIKPLTNGQKFQVAKALSRFTADSDEGEIDTALKLIAGNIISIEGLEKMSPVDAVLSLKSFETQMEIVKAVTEIMSMGGDDVGNSDSSPG